MTVSQAYRILCERLAPLYGDREASSVAYRLLEDGFGLSRIDVLLRADGQIVENERFNNYIERLSKGEPVQYVVGFEEFMGRRFAVAPGVLIPRPETEEIVVKLLNILDKGRKYTIYDIGTGSGAIAISLALELPKSFVSASDISPAALEIADANAKLLGAKVDFGLNDIFAEQNIENRYDIIISNPPYVTESDRLLMRSNVVNYEPQMALYVPDNNPLIYHIAIIDYAIKSLNDAGMLVFEINERYSGEIVSHMRVKGMHDIAVHQDFNGKDRMIWATK